MNNLLKPFGTQSFFVGLGVAAVTYLLGPQIKETVRPIAVKGTQGAMMLSDKTKEMMEEGKDRIEGMMENVKGKDGMMQGQAGAYEMLINELREERERSNSLMEKLNDKMNDLKNEIAHIKEGNLDIVDDKA